MGGGGIFKRGKKPQFFKKPIWPKPKGKKTIFLFSKKKAPVWPFIVV